MKAPKNQTAARIFGEVEQLLELELWAKGLVPLHEYDLRQKGEILASLRRIEERHHKVAVVACELLRLLDAVIRVAKRVGVEELIAERSLMLGVGDHGGGDQGELDGRRRAAGERGAD